MFERKKLWMMLAATAFVAACGGGSGGGGGGTDTSGSNTGPGTTTPSDDTALAGHILMEGNNHLLFNDGLQSLAVFQDPDRGIFGQAKGPNGAPLRAFGFRIINEVQGDNLAGNDEAIGRLGISLRERTSTAGTETQETMQIIVNGVRLTTDAGNVLGAELTSTASMIVAGRTASNQQIGPVEISIPSSALRIAPSTDFGGGAFDSVLLFDLAQAFSQATGADATTLSQLSAMSGRFDMDVTLSAADIHIESGTTTTRLAGASIAVPGSGAAPVEGSGVSGNIWLEILPPS